MRLADIIGALITIALCAIAFYLTTTWIPPILPGDPGAAFFPRIALAIMFVFSLLLLVQALAASKSGSASVRAGSVPDAGAAVKGKDANDIGPFLTALLASAALVAGIYFVGFEVPAFVFLFVLLGWRTGRWLWALIGSLVGVAVMYLVFVPVLNVRLPLLFLPQYVNLF